MSSIRVRSYLDTNAPQFDGQDKRAFIKFMKAMFESPSYNAKVVSTITVDKVSKTISVPTSGTASFSVGNLVRITGTLDPSFQTTFYRVIEASDAKLILSISNLSTVAYPANDLSNSILIEHAPLDWEVCYSTDIQFSIRSKDPTSSKTVLTCSESKNPKLNVANTGANVCHVRASKNIVNSTGALIDDYTALTNSKSTNSEALHFIWSHSSYYTSATIVGNVPWFIISSSKFVYIIVGSEQSSRNFIRNPSTTTYRNVFHFGDPDFIGDPSYLDYSGFLLKTDYTPNSEINNSIGDTGGFTTKINGTYAPIYRSPVSSGYWMRPFEATSTDIEAVTLTSAWFSAASNNGAGPIPYPNGPSRGLLFFPIFVSLYLSGGNNGGNYVRSILPFTVFSPNSLMNYTNGNYLLSDFVIFKTYDNKNILSICTSTTTSLQNAYAFFELD